MELTERGSTVMKVSEIDEYSIFDPVINAFRVLGQLYNLAVSGEVTVVPESSYADTLTTKAIEESSDLLLLPWSETGSMSDFQTISSESVQHKLASDSYSNFVRRALDAAQCNAAVFINKGFSGSLKQRPSALQRSMSALSSRSHRDHTTTLPSLDRSHHIFMPFFGGADGRVALRLVLQLAENPEVTATIIHYSGRGNDLENRDASNVTEQRIAVVASANLEPQTHSMLSREDDATFFASMQRSLSADLQSRVMFDSLTTSAPIDDALSRAQEEVAQKPKNGGDMVIVGRHLDLFKRIGSESSCLGVAAHKIIDSGIKASLLVVQARGSGLG